MLASGRRAAAPPVDRRAEPAGPSGLWLLAPVLTGALAVLVVILEWRGADWPAQIFRTEMFRTDGLTVWNNHWYGGHHSVGYSLLLPPFSAAVGTSVVAVASAGISAAAVERLLRRIRPDPTLATVGATLFGLGLVANVAVGRLAFLLGVTIALLALLAWAHGRLASALVLAAASGLASPVAALFLGITAAGVAAARWSAPADLVRWSDVRGQGPLVAAGAMGPVLLLAIVFPAGGSFPFALGGLAASLVTVAGLWVVTTWDDREIRVVVALTTLALLAAWAIPTPLGGNMIRFPMFFALPVAVMVGGRIRRGLVAAGAALLLVWAWSAATDAVLWARDDPTREASFFAPMIAAVTADAEELPRVEIPFTRRHWEAAHVAPVLPLARGWERQLDRRNNPVFYEDDGLTALDYHVWLRENAVRYVALPDVDLDPSAEQEAVLLERGQPYLRPVWENDDWRLWEVTNTGSIVGNGAELVELAADRIVIDVEAPGTVVVRVRFSPHWEVEGPSCVREDADGWIEVHAATPGRHELVISPDALAGLAADGADPCDTDEGDGAE